METMAVGDPAAWTWPAMLRPEPNQQASMQGAASHRQLPSALREAVAEFIGQQDSITAFNSMLHRLAYEVQGDAQPDSQRRIHLHAHARDRLPSWLIDQSIDLHAMGVCAKSASYHRKEVTGVDRRVQQVVAQQLLMRQALRTAIRRIEREDLRDFAFVCLGGTHRSVAALYLLKRVAYPRAVIHLSTDRTKRAGRDALNAVAATRRLLEGQYVAAWWHGEVHLGAVRQVSEYAETVRIFWTQDWLRCPTQSVLTIDCIIEVVNARDDVPGDEETVATI